MDRAAVVGESIRYSLSPKIFLFLSKKLERPLSYQILELDRRGFQNIFKKKVDFIGWNITIPYKEAILPHLSKISRRAKRVGAVNVVRFEDEKLFGENTDAFGIAQTLREQKHFRKQKSAVLFGAGGAARAVAYVLGEMKVQRIFVVNRSRKNAASLCRHFNRLYPKSTFINGMKEKSDPIPLFINSTPMQNKGPFAFESHGGKKSLAFDLVYRSNRTPFLRQAAAHGIKTVNGLDMLIWQAIQAWEIWYGRVSGKQRLKNEVKKYLMRT